MVLEDSELHWRITDCVQNNFLRAQLLVRSYRDKSSNNKGGPQAENHFEALDKIHATLVF